MSNADKIGLLPGFGWLTGHGWLFTLLVVWLFTPAALIAVGAIGESRLVPLDSWNGRQYWSFFPGDLFLGVMTAGLLIATQSLPERQAFYNATWWHVTVLATCVIVAVVLTIGELRSGMYPSGAILSPTKLYHNGVLYVGYGYVVASTLVACLFGGVWRPLLLPAIFGLVWVAMLAVDSKSPPEVAAERASHAHVTEWKPIWRR